MGFHKFLAALLFALVLAKVERSACYVLKGRVSCLDCDARSDLSDIKVVVKCSQVKKLAMGTTAKDGSFKTELPSDTPTPLPVCKAKILGGPNQLYTSTKTMFSKIVKTPGSDSFAIAPALKFYSSCPLAKNDPKCAARNANFGSSKTVDLPLPPEWGLAPSSYYIPFIPIIGIP